MASFDLLLIRRRRRWRHDLIHLLDALGLYLEAGYDLSYAWGEAIELDSSLREWVVPREGEGMVGCLARLAESFPLIEARMWFSVLRELYASGAGAAKAVRAVADTLRAEHERELEAHCRDLPGRVNVLVLLFFLPPTLILLFSPLLIEISGAFR